jgi:hypothetical protein
MICSPNFFFFFWISFFFFSFVLFFGLFRCLCLRHCLHGEMQLLEEKMNQYGLNILFLVFFFFLFVSRFCRYILPNHMLFHIAQSLPTDVQSLLACCSPVPPAVKTEAQVFDIYPLFFFWVWFILCVYSFTSFIRNWYL